MRKLAAFVALLALACGDSPAGPGGEIGTGGSVAAISVEQGSGQRGPPQQALPDSIVGQVTDGGGDPVQGVLVNFEVTSADGGQFETVSLQTNSNGRVFNRLVAGTKAWTSLVPEDSTHTARLVASREGRPDEITSFQFVIQPGEIHRVSVTKVLEDGTADQSGGDGVAAAQPATVWRDDWRNPIPYTVSVSGPAHAETLEGAPSWTEAIVADSAGAGTVTIQARNGESSISGTFEVTTFDGGAETWICVVLERGKGSQDDCEGPPDAS